MQTETISHHLLRRRARAKAHALNDGHGYYHYFVRKAQRGPYRWRVERVALHPKAT